MEHARRFDGIQAGHAANAGRLLTQYLEMSADRPEQQRFEATLTICTLHTLLSQCAELLKYAQPRIPDLDGPLGPEFNALGMSTLLVRENTFPEVLTGAGLLVHLRDALSHPAPDEKFVFVPTGFTTTNSPTGVIDGYVFASSPWVKDDRRQPFGIPLPARRERAVQDVIDRFCTKDRKNADLRLLSLDDGRFDVGLDGRPYVPLLIAEIPLAALIKITLRLSAALSMQTAPA